MTQYHLIQKITVPLNVMGAQKWYEIFAFSLNRNSSSWRQTNRHRDNTYHTVRDKMASNRHTDCHRNNNCHRVGISKWESTEWYFFKFNIYVIAEVDISNPSLWMWSLFLIFGRQFFCNKFLVLWKFMGPHLRNVFNFSDFIYSVYCIDILPHF